MSDAIAIVGGTIVTEVAAFPGTLVIRGGVISSIEEATSRGPLGAQVIDVAERFVLPGGIDPHVHYRDVGTPDEREDFLTGSSASAAGGVTTILEHPVSVPPVHDAQTFHNKLSVASSKSIIDFGLWGAVLPGGIERMLELHDLGAVAFKAFMSDNGPHYPMVDDAELFEALRAAGRVGAIIGVHAESEALLRHFENGVTGADWRSVIGSRPALTEEEAIQRAILLCSHAKARLHLVHMSIESGADLVSAARARGVDVSAETCPHYLHFELDDFEHLGALAKCKPPLRTSKERAGLWRAVERGAIQMLASDHAPYALSDKTSGDFKSAPWGIVGAQTILPVMLSDAVLTRSWDLPTFVRFTSTNAARRFGLYPRKGTIQVGSDADLIVIDLDGKWKVSEATLLSKQKWSPYVGSTLKGRIERTIVRGNTVFVGDAIVAEPGTGQFVRPAR